MLRLTQVELLGFKSFPHKTALELDGGVNCIVGPNGSGKSNVADAIMFAFGSQSARELRTSNLSGLIFAGTEQLRPLNLASVTLHFECTAAAPEKEAEAILSDYDPDSIEVPEAALPVSAGGGGLPGAHAGSRLWRHVGSSAEKYSDPTPSIVKQLLNLKAGERVSLTRRVFRDGSGGYFLNGETVRLKDVDAFFDRYNMGRSAIFSVSQGEVERKILAGPQDLREWLAEATGIALLLQQKDRAQLKLKRAQQNFERLGDILHHTRTLVEDLGRQRQRAEAHQRFARQLRAVELNEIRREIEFAQRQLDSAGKAAIELGAHTAQERERLEQAQQAVDALQRQWRECDTALAQAEQILEARRGEAERLRRESAVALRSAEAAAEALAQARQDEQEAAALAGKLATELASAQGAFEGAREGMLSLRQQAEQARSAEEAARFALETAGRAQEEAADRSFALAQEAARLSNEREALARHSEQVQGQIGALSRHSEGARERLAALTRERDSEAQRYAGTAQSVAALTERLEGLKAALERSAAEILGAEEASGALKNELAGFKAKKRALEEIALEAQQQAGALHSLLSDVTLGGTLHRATEITFPPARRSAFTRLLAHLSEALVCPPGSESQLLERMGPASGDVLTLWGNSQTEGPLHAQSLWREISGPGGVISALQAHLGDVAVAADLAAAAALLETAPGLSSVVLDDGSALLSRSEAWLGQPPAERARAVAKRSDIAALEEQIAAAQSGLALATQRLGDLTARRDELQQERDAASAELAAASERLKAGDELLRRLNAQHSDREGELRLLEAQGEQLQIDLATLTARLPEIESRLAELEQEQAQAKVQALECSEARARAEAALEACRKAHSEALTRRELAEQQLGHLEQQCMNLADQENNLRRRHEQLNSRIAGLEMERDASANAANVSGDQAAQLSGELEASTLRISGLREQRGLLSAQTEQAQGEAARQAQALSRLEQDSVAASGQRDRAAERLDAWLHELRERFNLSLTALLSDPAVTAAPPDAEMDASEAGRLKLREEKARLRSELEAIGPVNILSITQHEEQSSRLAFLERQALDLEKAAADLRGLVASLDERTEEQYRANLDQIGARFDGLFKELFGGGWARLRFVQPAGSPVAEAGAVDGAAAEGEAAETRPPLGDGLPTAPGSLINAGVEVEVQLPGSRRHNLRSLSGGQRSLIFLALFFSVHSVRSPGFCILDEADAALDDANVGRFAGLIERVARGDSEHPAEQFIVVTHNKRTMETGDKLVGVVGRPKGVSNLLDVNLRDARKMADQAPAANIG